MNLREHVRAVEAADRRVDSAHAAWREARHACVARARARPLAGLAIVAGFGATLGGLRLRPWRMRGLRAVLRSGVIGGVATALRLLGELDLYGAWTAPERRADTDPAAAVAETAADAAERPTP